MSIHSSLRSGGKDKKHRSVLKRYERLKMLKDKNLWDDSKSVLGIPKVKMQKLRVKKEKAAAADTAAGAVAAPAAGKPAAGKPAPSAEASGKAEKK